MYDDRSSLFFIIIQETADNYDACFQRKYIDLSFQSQLNASYWKT